MSNPSETAGTYVVVAVYADPEKKCGDTDAIKIGFAFVSAGSKESAQQMGRSMEHLASEHLTTSDAFRVPRQALLEALAGEYLMHGGVIPELQADAPPPCFKPVDKKNTIH